MQSKRLPDLQSLRALLLLDFEPACSPFGELPTQLGPLVPIHTAEDSKSFRRFGLESIQMAIQNFLAPATVQINIVCHAGFIEQVEQFRQGLPVPTAAEGFAKMIVRVDDRELWFIHQSRFRREFRSRPKVFEEHGWFFPIFGLGG